MSAYANKQRADREARDAEARRIEEEAEEKRAQEQLRRDRDALATAVSIEVQLGLSTH